jgi:hypothetical protein
MRTPAAPSPAATPEPDPEARNPRGAGHSTHISDLLVLR